MPGSTHAGMVVGFAKDGRQRKVIGIDASATPRQTKAQVLDIARKTAKPVELGRNVAEVLLKRGARAILDMVYGDDGQPPDLQADGSV